VPPAPNGTYFMTRLSHLAMESSLTENIINGPPTPPPGYGIGTAAVVLPRSPNHASRLLTVPAFNWVFGCFPQFLGAMIAGYYDRNGFSNMYTGRPTAGLCPGQQLLAHLVGWVQHDPSLPLAASHNGVDGRVDAAGPS